jgi:large subunit ribosomal protein L15
MTTINLEQLEMFPAGTEVTPALLVEKGLARGRRPIKILANGTLSKPLTIKAQRFSAKAKIKIEASGGKTELLDIYA